MGLPEIAGVSSYLLNNEVKRRDCFTCVAAKLSLPTKEGLMRQFHFNEVHSVLFFGVWGAPNPSRIIESIDRNLGGVFDAPPAILPVGDDAPREVPRFLLRSGDDRCVLHVGPERATLILRQNEDIMERAQFLAKRLVEVALDSRWIINRMGLVATGSSELKESVIQFLNKKYGLHGGPDTSIEVQLNWLHRLTWKSEEVNRWIRLANSESFSESTLLATVDVNLVPQPDREVTVNDAGSFFRMASDMMIEEIDKVIQ